MKAAMIRAPAGGAMTGDRKMEAAVGVFVVAGIAALVMLAVRVGNLTLQTDAGAYRVTARFEDIGGLKVRAPVSMSGIRIGQVVALDFDPESYEAVATLEIEGRFDRVPADSAPASLPPGCSASSTSRSAPGGRRSFSRPATRSGSPSPRWSWNG